MHLITDLVQEIAYNSKRPEIGALTSLSHKITFSLTGIEETQVNIAIVNIAILTVVFFAATKLLASLLLGKIAVEFSPDKMFKLCLRSFFVNMFSGMGRLRVGSETQTPRPVRRTSISAQDEEGCSALHQAVKKIDGLNEVKSLVKQGVDVNHRDHEGKTALHYLVEGLSSLKQKIEMIRILVENGTRIDEKDEAGYTPLLHLVKSVIFFEKTEIAKALVNKGADVNEKNNEGETPVYLLVNLQSFLSEEDKVKMLVFLMEQGAKIDEKANNGETALHMVSSLWSSVELTKTLIKLLNAGLEVKNDLGLTPLTCAVYRGDVETIEIFAEKGAKVNARNNFGCTPLQGLARSGLYLAAMNGWQRAVEILMYYGADVDATAQNFLQTPAYLAMVNKRPAVVDMLMEKSQSYLKWPRYFLTRALIVANLV